MRNIKIVFSYDGARFFGSQAQSNKKTVQDELELAIFKLTGEKVRLTSAGRTDRGVHAFSQVGNFMTVSDIPADKFAQALNSKLGGGIIVSGAFEVPEEFHSRKKAKRREYLYFVFNGKSLPVLFWDRVLHVTKPLDLKKMSEAAQLFIGEHDFGSYCAKGGSQKGTRRHVYKLDVAVAGSDLIKLMYLPGELICFRIVANAFLYKMVRFIVGTLLDVGTGKIDAAKVKRSISGETKGSRSMVVPSCGLYLNNVKY